MKVEHLSKEIEQRLIIDDVNFELKKGEIVGLIGRNGEGKTTIFRLIANHYNKTKGHIFINEENIDRHRELYSQIFYIDSQYHSLSGMTPKTIAKQYQELYPSFDTHRFLGLVDAYQLPINKSYRTYSKGMQGLLLIILAICTNATYILLDEPLDGLDFYVKKQALQLMLEEVAEAKKTLLISSHNLLELEYIIDRALIIKKGRLVKNYQLNEVKESIKKIQMIFPNNELPRLVTENATILESRGKVTVALFHQLSPELITEISSHEPILFEELPVSLEDVVASQVLDDTELVIAKKGGNADE
ncbi:ABC transporter ATP-binding protein [Vagococcus xieshaowenii]|uniref:ABC transporter ATP-binding protein n=1 Tax=Vagococcus xieshaowenii TaxID=2562451 RepID=A0AAJ5JQD6_9ENTE|nr:ABC transporter ATP-binding protein [Vagococcus xieshaowenii]QCA28624.1 ABC transporter ATP-binding protein [Vagococcus xieshaowenii]TFZ40568.1 ABC transporter ATP-binding protein [Vagococcus xieshaowenii]